jgi:hypothetical protein
MSDDCAHLDHVRDVSPRTRNRHATKHFHRSHHPLVRSLEPGEDWAWCYVDELFLEPAPRP